VRRAFRLLVGAVIAIWLMGQFAIALRWLYENYGRESETGVLRLLEYLFREDEAPEEPLRQGTSAVSSWIRLDSSRSNA